jgi:hypothetical protein
MLPQQRLHNSRIVGPIVFCVVHTASKESKQFFPELLVIDYKPLTPGVGNVMFIMALKFVHHLWKS